MKSEGNARARENKRKRVEEEEKKEEGYVRIVGEGLRNLVGGVKFCREEELARAMLLEFLKSQGEIEEVKGLVEVTVQTMAGASFGVMLEEGGGSSSNVRALKAEIEEAEGALRYRQELFILVGALTNQFPLALVALCSCALLCFALSGERTETKRATGALPEDGNGRTGESRAGGAKRVTICDPHL